MTDAAPETVRRSLYAQAVLEVLAADGAPMQRRDVLRILEERIEPTAYESEMNTGGGVLEARWRVYVSFVSTDMKLAGWLIKTPGGWQITDLGRQVLSEAQAGGPELAPRLYEAYRVYAERLKAESHAQADYASVVTAALEHVDPGRWTTYLDLASLVNVPEKTMKSHLFALKQPGSHRVLLSSGQPSEFFSWPDSERDETQREALTAEGVEFESNGAADPTQRVTAEDMRAYLEDAGLLTVIRKAWLVRGSSVDGRDLIPTWLSRGFVSLRAAKLREVEPGISRDDLKAIVDDDYSQSSYAAKSAKVDEFHAFLSRMQHEDLVVTTSQGKLYVGTIAGAAEYERTPDNLWNLKRPVVWSLMGIDYADLPGDVKSRLQIQYDVVEMTQQIDALDDLRSVGSQEQREPDERTLVLPDATDELAESLNVDRAWLQECIDLLRDRPQLIFHGPPGTGKTYIAQHLAAHLAGDNVRLVQFHPAFSYEDFFEGYRPATSGGFELKPGPLRKTVDAARENPTSPYFLIIDEINRGNLAKIFGELYFLLEYRNENVDLLYATDDDIGFSLPPNVFLIGTMNTADRSIALVDAAMRRRFAFMPLHPNELPTSDVLRRWLDRTGRDLAVADLLDELNRRIDDDDFKIGPSYFMRDAVHDQGGLERAWRTAILPLLEEHHYGDGIDVAQRYGLDTIRRRIAQTAGEAVPPTVDPTPIEGDDANADPA